MPLFPHLPFDRDETHLSFAARLAAFHTGGRLAPFLSDLGVKAADYARGLNVAVLALCDHAGVDPRPVLANTPISTGKASYRLRDEEISADILSNPSTVFCPACLDNDDRVHAEPALARHGRFAWSLRVVRTCPVHGIALVERGREEWCDRFEELAFRVPERGDALREMVAQAARRSVSPLQEYALARLAGDAGPAWLDGQSLEQALRATEMLGAVVAFGPSRKVSELNSDEWDQAGRVGFAFTSRGEEGIREALSGLQAEFRKAGKQPVHRNVFGRLYEWLASETVKEPGDIRRIVREHMFDTIELPSGARILGGTLPQRKLHSAASLARETGLYPPTLRNVLVLRGLIPCEGAHHVFDANAGREVAASVCEMIHVNTVHRVLNCSRYQARGLIDEQLLMPIAVGEAGAPGRTQKAVTSSSVRAFLAAIEGAARPVDAVPPGCVPLAKAAEKAKTSRVDIVHLVLGGYLSDVVRLSSMQGYAAVHVDPAEVREALAEHLPGVSVAVVATRMHLPVRTVWALVEDREGGAFLASTVLHGPNGRHTFRRVMPETIERFQETYATLARIAAALQIDRRELERELRSARAHPTIARSDVGVDLFRMEDLPVRHTAEAAKVAA